MDLPEYDQNDFWTKIRAKDNFAARWRGNFTLPSQGRYSWSLINSGTARLSIIGQGGLSGVNRTIANITGNGAHEWINYYPGTYELNLEFIHTTGSDPHIELGYVGPETHAQIIAIQSSEVSAIQ